MGEGVIYIGVMIIIIDAIIITACIIPHFVKEKISYQWRKWLWFVLAVRLIVPVHLLYSKIPIQVYTFQMEASKNESIFEPLGREETDFSEADIIKTKNISNQKTQNVKETAETHDVKVDSSKVENVQQNNKLIDIVTTARRSPELCFYIIWGIGAIFAMGLHLLQFTIVKVRIQKTLSHCEDLYIQEKLVEISKRYSLKRVPDIVICKSVKSPMLLGYWKPMIVLPVKRFAEDEITVILQHELYHYKNKDLWYKLFLMVISDIYWFNPVLLLMRKMADQDMEYTCDEKVVENFSIDEKKVYAGAILRGMEKQRTIIFSTHFVGKKTLAKVRIKNIFTKKNKWISVIFAVLFSITIMGTCLWNVSIKTVVVKTAENLNDMLKNLPIFQVESLETVNMSKKFELADYYITTKLTRTNCYYVDENSVLWGWGYNQNSQLGNVMTDSELFCKERIQIATDVISVDASDEGLFCIYLTSDGKLYSIGRNLMELQGKDLEEHAYYGAEYFPKTSGKVLLMENVAYARAGKESIVVLKQDGSVWWWGNYSNERVMPYYSYSPKKMLDNCIYAVTGDNVGAAITEKGELYTWGRNLLGECGAAVAEDNFLRQPKKVLDDVRMVWPEKIVFNNDVRSFPGSQNVNSYYEYNIFAQKNDGSIMAAGAGLGEKERIVTTSRYRAEDGQITYLYSDEFVPIQLEKYSNERNKKRLNEIEKGSDINKVISMLREGGIPYKVNILSKEYSIEAENEIFCFDKEQKLRQKYL